jgi:hypothetical protein
MRRIAVWRRKGVELTSSDYGYCNVDISANRASGVDDFLGYLLTDARDRDDERQRETNSSTS